jgi:TRAP-type C4-dicarboxylate transport system permease small subunit
MQTLKKAIAIFNKFYIILGVAAVIGTVFFCFLQFVSRYILHIGIMGCEELARVCFIWIAFVGAPLCVNKMSHPSITLLKDALSVKSQKILSLFAEFLFIGFAALLLYTGARFVALTIDMKIGSLKISSAFLNTSIVFCGVGIIINSCYNMIRIFANFKKFALFGEDT